MFLYNFNIAKANFPFETLTYSSTKELKVGQICLIEVRGTTFFGVVKEQSDLNSNQIKNLLSVVEIYNFYLGPKHLEFLNKVAFLTFNSFNNLFVTLTTPLSLIKNLGAWDNSKALEDKNGISPQLEYIINKDWDSVIEGIIETIIKKNITFSKNYNILIIYPEKNSLEKGYSNLIANSNFNKKIEVYNTLTASKKKLLPVLSLLYGLDNLEPEVEPKLKIIFANKNILFANLAYIDQIVVVDEANPSYISETRIYFDTREIAFWASLVYSLNLTFVSTVPSVRFYNQNKEQLSKLEVPELSIKFLERTGRQSDFENILNEINCGGLIVSDYEDY